MGSNNAPDGHAKRRTETARPAERGPAPGAAMLVAFRASTGLSQATAAAALGVSGPTMHEWESGGVRPRDHHRDAIAKWTNGKIPASAWVFPDEAENLDAVRPFKKGAA